MLHPVFISFFSFAVEYNSILIKLLMKPMLESLLHIKHLVWSKLHLLLRTLSIIFSVTSRMSLIDFRFASTLIVFCISGMIGTLMGLDVIKLAAGLPMVYSSVY